MSAKLVNLLAAALLSSSACALATQASAAKHVMFILDASNSMWGRIDGVAKIDIAKDVLTGQFSRLADGTRTGLIAYGHRFPRELKDCSDMELVGGYGTYSPTDVKQMLDYVTPKGQTPIAATLEESVNWVADDPQDPVENPTVVLITDGVESCDGNPCAAAKKLADAGINTRIHVVGFDLTPDQRKQVECISENGGGKYFDARNASGLDSALKKVEYEVAQAEPAPPTQPVSQSVFLDDFDGTELKPHWSVQNADLDSYIVENGELLAINSDIGGLDVAETRNVFTLAEALPEGDWDATITFKAELKTGRDQLQFGLSKDTGNGLFASLLTFESSNSSCAYYILNASKISGGEVVGFDLPLNRSAMRGKCGSRFESLSSIVAPLAENPGYISMHKRGRSYHFSAYVGERDEAGKPIIYTTEPLTSLRVPGKLSFAIGKSDSAPGEIAAMVDKVEIISASP